jgi:hypothetical protein
VGVSCVALFTEKHKFHVRNKSLFISVMYQRKTRPMPLIDLRFICVHNVLSFFAEFLHSDGVLMVPRYNTFSFNHNDFASFHLTNKAEFFKKKLKCGSFKVRKCGVIIYRRKDRIGR